MCVVAVQEERQRNKEREGEVESTHAANEEMPVEKILEAEMAVEQKIELHSDGSSGTSSVSRYSSAVHGIQHLDVSLPPVFHSLTRRKTTLSRTSARQLINSSSLWWSGPKESRTSQNWLSTTRSSFYVLVNA